MSRHPRIASVNVYAIAMNHYGYDGQLGCAAITLHDHTSSDQFERIQRETMSQLEHWIRTSESALPAYAMPRFVRILVNEGAAPDQGGMSGDSGSERVSLIMKKLKTGLRKDGQSGFPHNSSLPLLTRSLKGFLIPQGNKDRMYWIEREGSGYVPLTDSAAQRLVSGKAQL